jgi:hypothetical protein
MVRSRRGETQILEAKKHPLAKEPLALRAAKALAVE